MYGRRLDPGSSHNAAIATSQTIETETLFLQPLSSQTHAWENQTAEAGLACCVHQG